ncbi:uncharacterized protein LOC121383496 [Gigantopelta aegis]|uniref:uncharacterized protein LOC121383496 n=1 Tax=Gigantopelta aegis TaxID=1735272 RepID=UPI001B88BFD3|nr:uncharacterized protein LOC121383496 [Gigantopelta aegis]
MMHDTPDEQGLSHTNKASATSEENEITTQQEKTETPLGIPMAKTPASSGLSEMTIEPKIQDLYGLIKDTITLEQLKEKISYLKKHKPDDMASFKSAYKVQITHCGDSIEIQGQRSNVFSAKSKLLDLFSAAKYGWFPLENAEQVNRLESKDGEKLRKELEQKNRCYVSLVKKSELSGAVKPAKKTQPTKVFCCWTTTRNQTVQVMSGGMSSDECDVLVLPVLGVDNNPKQPTWIKEEKSGIFSNVLDEIHEQGCVLKQTVSSKTKFVFLSFPSEWQGGASREKSTIENSMKGLFNSLRDVYSESGPLQPMVVQIDLQDLNGFPLKKALKPIIYTLNSELLRFEHPICLVLSVVEETDAEDLTEAFKDVMKRKVIAGKFENYTSRII